LAVQHIDGHSVRIAQPEHLPATGAAGEGFDQPACGFGQRQERSAVRHRKADAQQRRSRRACHAVDHGVFADAAEMQRPALLRDRSEPEVTEEFPCDIKVGPRDVQVDQAVRARHDALRPLQRNAARGTRGCPAHAASPAANGTISAGRPNSPTGAAPMIAMSHGVGSAIGRLPPQPLTLILY